MNPTQFYPVPAGHTFSVSVLDGLAHVTQVEDPTVKARVVQGSPAAFGPYSVAKSFMVQDPNSGATVTVAEAANALSAAQAALVAGIPTADQEDSVSVYSDAGVLKVSTGA